MKIHKPVLLGEVIRELNLKKGSIVVDATLGSGGHAEVILKEIGEIGKLIAIDCDVRNTEKFDKKKNVFLINENFSELESILKKLEIEKVDAILADLGYSSDQLENKAYGLSFQLDGPLDMRLDQRRQISAKDIINQYSEKDLEEIFREFGEERWAKKIATAIVSEREKKEIETTQELAEIIIKNVPRSSKQKIHPATKVFQALRIAVNQELTRLIKFLDSAVKVLAPSGRLVAISFHSIEDRIVKNKFRENARGCICPSDFPKCVCGKKPGAKLVTKKPIMAGEEEIKKNPRSRSAKLRVLEKNKNKNKKTGGALKNAKGFD